MRLWLRTKEALVADLIYGAMVSLDGFVADSSGNFDWATPDAEVHRAANDLERPIGTYLYGRRMYQVMRFWQTAQFSDTDADEMQAAAREYAGIWQQAEKVVFSRTLDGENVTGDGKTRVERRFLPADIAAMKARATRPLAIGGPTLAMHALRADLVDEIAMFVNPVIVGGGNRMLPDAVHLKLELNEERRFGNGVVLLRYRVQH